MSYSTAPCRTLPVYTQHKIQPSFVIFYSLSLLVCELAPFQVIRKLPHSFTSFYEQKYEKVSKGKLELVCE